MSREFGNQAELKVVEFLKKEKFFIIAQNYRKFFGEIDIIAHNNQTIVFVEVKARKNTYVSLFQLIPKSKQMRIIKTAKNFLSHNPKFLADYTARFDVALLLKADNNEIKIDYISNAFQI